MRLKMTKLVDWFECVGRTRAAHELYRLGYKDYAKNLLCKK